MTGAALRAHRSDPDVKHAQAAGMRGVREDRLRMGAPADVPGMRRDAVLRQFAQPAREQHAQASGHPVIASAEPGESWLYCYPDDAFAEDRGACQDLPILPPALSPP